jgi:hypothetical protein
MLLSWHPPRLAAQIAVIAVNDLRTIYGGREEIGNTWDSIILKKNDNVISGYSWIYIYLNDM